MEAAHETGKVARDWAQMGEHSKIVDILHSHRLCELTGVVPDVQIDPTVPCVLRYECDHKSCVNTEQTLGRIFKICGSCRKKRYCSEACQATDWKEHSVTCRAR